MRPPPAETDIEARLRALEQWRKDITEHLKRYEKRPIATLNGAGFEPSHRQRLRIHGKTSSNPSLKANAFPECSSPGAALPRLEPFFTRGLVPWLKPGV